MTVTWQESVSEMGGRWFTALSPSVWLGFEVGLFALGLCCLLLLNRAKPAFWKLVQFVFISGAVAWSVHLALEQAWLADDAFISFRYARNFAEGNGLVWNVGERLEGYTNFLWTVVLGLGERLGLSSGLLSTALTLNSVVLLAIVGTAKLGKPGWVPLAPALLVLSPAFIEFGTSGLEAGPAAMCIGFAALWLADPARRHQAAWWVLIAALLRPDHALFFAPLGLLQLFAGRRALQHTVGAGSCFAAYWLGRWAYFGEFLPNTFHAKSGGGAYWLQGGLYWAEFSLATGLWLAVPAVLVVAVLLAITPRDPQRLPHASLLFSLIGGVLFTAYIARVGGDFMEFRFGLTSLVLFAFAADSLLSTLAAGRAWATALAALALLPLGITPRMIKDGEKKWHLARESSFYRVKTWSPLEIESGSWAIGRSLASLPEQGAKAPPLAAGCIGMVGYLSRVPIVDRFGLTNARIARKQITERGRPGHEKMATNAELMAEGAQWSVDPGWGGALESPTRFRVGSVDFWMLKQTPELSAALPLPAPSLVLSAIHSPAEAREQHHALSVLYASLPSVLREFEERWGLVDARSIAIQGNTVEVSAARLTVKGDLTAQWHHECPSPHRLRWTVASGTCSATEARCIEGALDARWTCTGPDVRLENFTFEPLEFDARLKRATPLGTEAMAEVVQEQADDAVPGLVTRFRFDTPLELARPEFEQSGEIFDVTHAMAAGQTPIRGMQGGGLLNGFAWGDRPKGRLRIRVPVIPGTPVLVSFLFGGGSACDRVRAVVLDGDAEVTRACGRQDEVLRPFARVITPRSRQLMLELVDEDEGAWGHALLDEFFVWTLPR